MTRPGRRCGWTSLATSLVLACVLPLSAGAQQDRSLSVRVTDDAGGAITGAIVVREGASGADTIATDERGRATFANVPRGSQRLTVIQPGFATAGRDLTIGDTAPGTIVMVLAPQALSETLMVVGEARRRATARRRRPPARRSPFHSRGPAVGQRCGALQPVPVEGYTRVDAFATYRVAHWRVQVNVKNVGDVRYFDSTSFNIHPQAPRQVVVGLSRQF